MPLPSYSADSFNHCLAFQFFPLLPYGDEKNDRKKKKMRELKLFNKKLHLNNIRGCLVETPADK